MIHTTLLVTSSILAAQIPSPPQQSQVQPDSQSASQPVAGRRPPDTIYVSVPEAPASPVVGWFQIVTAAVALYGAGLATATFIFQRSATKPLVRASIANALVPSPDGHVDLMLGLTAQNHGHPAVYLQEPQLELPNGQRMVFPYRLQADVQFPCKLERGQKCTALVPALEVVRGLKKAGYTGNTRIAVAFPDQLGKDYTSKPLTVHVEHWEKLALER